MLMIKAVSRNVVVCNGQEIGREPQVLPHRSGITIGSLTYCLEFSAANKEAFSRQRDELMKRHRFWTRQAPPSLDPTPSENHFVLQGFQFQTPQAAGAYGVVSLCVQVTTGEVYAAKRVQRTMRTLASVQEEVKILRDVSKHPHICSLHKVLYSDGDEFSIGSTAINDVWMVLEPWAPRTLDDFIALRDTGPGLTRVLHQAAQAVRHVHSLDIIHRDIKPGNFLLDHSVPPMVKLTDFGHSTRSRTCRDHTKGTIAYHAPEISALKLKETKDKENKGGVWSENSDAFSLGILSYELLNGRFERPEFHIDKRLHESLVKTLEESSNMLSDLTKALISWNPNERPTLRQVLLQPFWPDPETLFSDNKRRTLD